MLQFLQLFRTICFVGITCAFIYVGLWPILFRHIAVYMVYREY